MNTLGLLGRKLGMTHVYSKFGEFVPATVIEAGPCRVLEVKSPERDGYRALQLGFEEIPERKLSKPKLGQFKQWKAPPMRHVREIRVDSPEAPYQPGDQVTVEIFTPGEFVDVTGISKGKGFQGGMKRWGWAGGPASHGSMSHRRIGAMGSNTFPGRVWPGHHLHGRMGADRVTVQGLEVLSVDQAQRLMVVKGSVPGHPQALVMIRKSFKRPIKTKIPQPPRKKEKKAAAAAKAVAAKKKEK